MIGVKRMSYMALYRKFRPQTFEQVKGQEHVVRTLKNQIKNNRIGHAYLFTGTRGTGKTSVAKLFAKAINCLDPHDGEPCNCCEVCTAAAKDSFMDIVEIDAASNTGVDDIRRIIEEVRYTPVKGRYKVYIIDEVHMLSGSAFNAFLKTLEEPPKYAVFILATTEPHKLPITILSRCQRYDFHRISSETITGNLKTVVEAEGVEAEDKALEYIARIGDGSMRDSISLLDKCIAFNLGEKLTYENVLQTLGVVDVEVFSRVFRGVLASDASAALKEVEEAAVQGKDISQFVSDFVWYLRNLLLVNVGGSSAEELIGVSADNLKTLKEDAALCDGGILMRYIRIGSQLLNEIRFSEVKQILVEVALIKMAKPEMEVDAGSLADRIRQLESGAVKIQRSAAGPDGRPEVNMNSSSVGIEAEDNMIMGGSGPEPVDMLNNIPAWPDDYDDGASFRQQTEDQVSRCWGDIVAACDSRMLKMALKKSEAGGEDENGVVIYAPEGINFETVKSSVKDVEELITRITGSTKMVSVRPLSEKKSGAGSGSPFPDDLLNNINFNIGTEEI